jgi:hypothetical protein
VQIAVGDMRNTQRLRIDPGFSSIDPLRMIRAITMRRSYGHRCPSILVLLAATGDRHFLIRAQRAPSASSKSCSEF